MQPLVCLRAKLWSQALGSLHGASPDRGRSRTRCTSSSGLCPAAVSAPQNKRRNRAPVPCLPAANLHAQPVVGPPVLVGSNGWIGEAALCTRMHSARGNTINSANPSTYASHSAKSNEQEILKKVAYLPPCGTLAMYVCCVYQGGLLSGQNASVCAHSVTSCTTKWAPHELLEGAQGVRSITC